MATAAIIFQQDSDGNTTPGSRDDLVLSLPVTVLNQDDTGAASWLWAIIDKPSNSTASLVSPTSSTTTFIPDIEGTYLIKVIVNGDIAISDQQGAAVKTANLNFRIPAAKETIEFDNNRGWATAVNAALKTLDDGYASGVTSITASSPLTGGAITSTGTIGIPKATGSQDGYLAQGDWTTFNGKGSGTVTSVATTARLTGGTITTTGTLDLATSGISANTYQGIIFDAYGRATSASDQGYIKKVDWFVSPVDEGQVIAASIIDNGPGGGNTVGTKIVFTAAGTVTGVRFYWPTATTRSVKVSIWDSVGVRLGTATSSYSSIGIKTLAVTPFAVTPYTPYYISMWETSNQYISRYDTSTSTLGVTDSTVLQFPGTATAFWVTWGQSALGDAWPTSTDVGVIYPVDPIYTVP